MGAGTNKNRWPWVTQGCQEQLGKDYGEHSGAPQAHKMSEGGSIGYMVWNHIKVAHIAARYGAYLNLDEEIIARAP